MNYGLYLAASGVLTSMYRQDVLSNNLANVDTAGFKPDTPVFRSRSAARIEDGLALPSNAMLERLGAGVALGPDRISMLPGPVETTNDQFTAAISGDGFFAVSFNDGQSPQLRLTRDGRFARRADGTLLHAASGASMLDPQDKPITLANRPFTINQDGAIVQDGREVARLQVTSVPDAGSLEKAGRNLLGMSPEQAAQRRPAPGGVTQRALERSATDPILTTMGITDASIDVQLNSRAIQIFDELMGRAINTFARVA
ncbi:MAG: flagellar hook-basal body complex protein [Phycisphaeraceae bacterium]|nr:flagellar hook-basal body complex protein [Phycisphaeraceae bacterium]